MHRRVLEFPLLDWVTDLAGICLAEAWAAALHRRVLEFRLLAWAIDPAGICLEVDWLEVVQRPAM